MTTDELRTRFVSYFERQGHLHLPSSSLIPKDDPTLLFTNAGMVQFKRSFQGESDAPADRAVTSQKCLRVSGKHNDLEEVGRTARHHTFFEMLGNFSFGDYFKSEAIGFAWEFVTVELGLDPDRLWATVHHTDDEAFKLWTDLTPLPPSRVRRLGDKDNFWQMGETGPCGPCSELHYDLRKEVDDRITDEQFEVAGEADRFMEIWNLVFMQFDRSPEGIDVPLPAPSIDTGAGLERIASIIQGSGTNFHTDLFLPLIKAAGESLGIKYSMDPNDWEAGVPFRVLADHARAVAFLLADGVFPSNEKRGYVLRRILRRAVRHYWLLGRREPLLHQLVGIVVDNMSHTFPELATRREHLLSTTVAEEDLFLSTIEGGMSEIDVAMPEGGSGTVSGDTAFKLKDTFGIPEDLTQLIAQERGYEIDWSSFEEALKEQRARSRAGLSDEVGTGVKSLDYPLAGVRVGDRGATQEFVGYENLKVEADVLRWGQSEGNVSLVLSLNPFYAESGGQVSDHGWVHGDDWVVEVHAVGQSDPGYTVVMGTVVEGVFPKAPNTVVAEVDRALRAETERNHTATHLLHAALRECLGEHVQQAGSLVGPDRFRFDFSHRGPVSEAERSEIELRVNERILANANVVVSQRDYQDAIAEGAIGLFGEKYDDVVRVIEVTGVSKELCGGTHVRSTGQIGSFKIVAETGVAAGIRRIEALCGKAAYEWGLARDRLISEMATKLNSPAAELIPRLNRLLEQRDDLEQEVSSQRGELAADQLDQLLGESSADESRFLCGRIELSIGTDLHELGDMLRARIESGAVVLHVVFPDDNRHVFVSSVSDDLISKGLKAGDLVRVSSKATGSGGGGGAHFAQGGVGDAELASEGLQAAREWATGKVPNLVS